ncbi:MAG: hypothetical protein HQL87_07075 [Magnetococcales bacterium]|nr:hypothetical protein [Magnetococcales bacterium]
MRTCLRKTKWMGVLMGVALAGATVVSPRPAHAEGYFWDGWFGGGSAAVQSVPHAANGLAIYNTPSRSWAGLPAIVYASVPTTDGHYPVAPQHVVAGMPVQTVPVQPVVVQSKPMGVYRGGDE